MAIFTGVRATRATYGLRKLGVGVASVLLLTTLYMDVTAHADIIAEASSQPTVGQSARIATDTSIDNTDNVGTDVQLTADQPASTARSNGSQGSKNPKYNEQVKR